MWSVISSYTLKQIREKLFIKLWTGPKLQIIVYNNMILTKFGVATIQKPVTNIPLEFFHVVLNPEQRRVFQLVVNI
jgi:hypothetical protein